MNPLMAVAGVSVVVAGIFFGLWRWEDHQHKNTIADASEKIERAETNTRTAEEAFEKEKQALIDQKKIYDDERESRIRLQTSYTLIEKDLAEATSKIDSYRGRWKNASKKTATLSRIANRATDKRVQHFAATTCRAACGNDDDPRENAGAAPKTGTDNR